MRSDDLYSLPPDLPVPTDDGACRHLRGAAVPPIALPSTRGRLVRLDQVDVPWVVVYAYPRTGVPDVDSPPGWNAIPGARGCTPQTCAYRDREAELRALGTAVFGLSTQATEDQQEMATRLHLPFDVLSDSELLLTRALRLPTFRYGDWTLLKRHTLIIAAGRIEEVFYPVFPPDADAGNILRWLRERAVS
jgi:peroxiredoxin